MSENGFFVPARSFSVAEIASITGAKLNDEALGAASVERIATAAEGIEGSLVFLEGARHAEAATNLRATAVLCTPDLVDRVPRGVAALALARPQAAFARIGRLLHPETARPQSPLGVSGVSDRAFVDPAARLEANVTVEPGAAIGPGTVIGSGTVVCANAVIGRGCQIGRDCFIGPSASVQFSLLGDRVVIFGGAAIGQDGFGFVPGAGGAERFPQIGRVILQNDVEVGANATIDRGALTDTVVGEGTKIDNLVQIAHNVRIGRHCLIAGHCGLSGSSTLGDYVMLGGGVGLADHVSVGDKAQIAAAAGVMHDVPAGGRWAGTPAMPVRDFFRQVTAIRSLTKAKRGGENG